MIHDNIEIVVDPEFSEKLRNDNKCCEKCNPSKGLLLFSTKNMRTRIDRKTGETAMKIFCKKCSFTIDNVKFKAKNGNQHGI